MLEATMAQDVDARRRELLRRILKHQINIKNYVQKMRARRELVTNISVVSSAIAAALVIGPTVGGETFTAVVREGLGWEKDSSVWRLLCLASLIVYLVAAISARLNKSNDPTERINIAEACDAALETLRADVEFGKLSVRSAVGEYGQIIARALYIPEKVDEDTDPEGGGASISQSSRIVDRYRRNAEIVIPGMAIIFGCLVLITAMIGLVLGRGVASAGPQPDTASRVALSATQVKIGDTYSAAALGFSPGENLQFSWKGPTSGVMGDFPAGSDGNTTHGGIVESDPPGTYTITVIGLTSGRIASTELVVQPDK
ncbi:MAG: hypothetical protein ACRDSH_02475 [Pseudonocardiaceae bacterium]